MKSILLLSAGRRVGLLQAFRTEAQACLTTARVLAADMAPALSAACSVADASFRVPRAASADYVPSLIRLCKKESVGLVIPTIDTELLPLSERVNEFADEGIEVSISSYELVRKCRDKRLTHVLFAEHGIDAPTIFGEQDIVYPCFAKPFDGSRSLHTGIVRNGVEKQAALNRCPNTIFMQLVDRSEFEEFTVDMYYDKLGRLRCAVPRRRIEVRDGEVSKGMTEKNDLVPFLRERMGHLEGAKGCLTLQVFRRKGGGQFLGIELNPRFGGGFPLSYEAGANFPRWLIEEHMLGRSPQDFEQWRDSVLMLRYDAAVFTRPS